MLEGLNEKQKEAVTSLNGPILVLAGAGSGKTKVLTNRIAYLIDKENIDPSNILAITFTNKASKEMKDRIHKVLGNISYQIQISTFHSFGLLILKKHYDNLGYKKNFTILDTDDTLSVIKKILKEFNLDPKEYNPKMIKNKISSCKNELVSADDYEKYAHSDFDKIVLKVYHRYQEKLKINNSVDFDDLLCLPIELFKKYPLILQDYQENYKYILVDEYQDTNEAQYILVKMISAKYKNIFVVGDNDQSIYSFRGSNYQNILNFEKDYNNPKIIKLEKNYRSTKNILNAANSVIKNNKYRKEKNLYTDNEEGIKIKYYESIDEKDEAYYVFKQIEKLILDGVSLNDIAVLYRTNAQSRTIEEALLRENIPYKVVGSFYFYNRKEIKDLISYLKLLHNKYDDNSLLRIINVPKRKIGEKTIQNLISKANQNNICIYDAIESVKELEFKKIIEEIDSIKDSKSLTELVDLVLTKTGMKEELEKEKTIESEARIENLEEFKTITKNFEEKNGIISLDEFLEEISLVSDIEEHKDRKDVVTLMTIHSAKGLEFDNVFVIGMEEGIFPHKNSFCDSEGLEEERRLCYVAITRAKSKLWLINAKRRTIYGKDEINPVSRFINEIDEDLVEKTGVTKIDYKNNIDKNAEYQIGEKIYYEKYGEGIIVGVEEKIITVAFNYPTGIQKLIKGHKSIRKV